MNVNSNGGTLSLNIIIWQKSNRQQNTGQTNQGVFVNQPLQQQQVNLVFHSLSLSRGNNKRKVHKTIVALKKCATSPEK